MKITIVTVVYNNHAHIEECIRSVVSQTYKNVEYIVVDGGSRDGTVQILHKYEHEIHTCVSEPDLGIYDAMNKGMMLASGEVIGFLNSDDFYATDDVLEKIARKFDDGQMDSCYGDLVYVDATRTDHVIRYWRSGDYDRARFFKGWMPPHPTFFVRRSIYEQYGKFDLTLGSSADYELMLRFLLKHGITSVHIPDVLVKMRTGGVSNASFRNRLLANRMDRLAWKVNGLKPHFLTLFLKPLSKIGQFFN